VSSVPAAAFFTCLISLCESPTLSPHSVLAELWDVAYRSNRTLFWCLASSCNGDVRTWPISTDTSRIYFLPSTMSAEIPFTAPERMRCTSALYYLTSLSFAMYLSMFRGQFACVFKGKDCRYVVYDLPKYTLLRARKQISHSLDKGRVSEMNTALIFRPFVLRLFLL
jgi:hypothetical protein